MEKEVLIEVENVSKKFCLDLKTSLRYGLQDSLSAILPFQKESKLRNKEFWAVQDVSFTLKRGECIGLIGHNGAGKSTLLKMINGLINIDSGRIKLKGKIGALIELGAGFNPILTGRENIYNNAAVLGFSKKEIDEKMAAIIAFSEIEDFLDTPVQNYSSGMKVRLGFAVAAHLEPDILIIDEVLAVGDLGFVLKCFKTIDLILPKTAVVFVSHNMPMVSRICNQIILMEKGEVVYNGENIGKGIDLYYNRFAQNDTHVVFSDDSVQLNHLEVVGHEDVEIPQINWGGNLKILLDLKNVSHKILPKISINIFDKEQRGVAVFKPNMERFPIKGDRILISLEHENLQLSKGIYSINLNVGWGDTGTPAMRMNGIKNFQVIHDIESWPPFLLKNKFKIENKNDLA